MKIRYALRLAMALALAATSPAWASCDVTLVSINPSNEAALKANCGVGVTVTSINWQRNAVSLTGDITITPGVTGEFWLTAPLISGPNIFTATGNLSPSQIAVGASAIVIVPQLMLTALPYRKSD